MIESGLKNSVGARHASVAWTFWSVLALLGCLAIAATLTARGLYQDGTYYLIRMAEREWFYLVDPARTTVQVLRQAPVVLLMRTAWLGLPTYAVVFTFAMLAMPLLLVIPCWFIPPRESRAYALVPILSLLVGLFTHSIEAVGEAAMTTSLYWVMLFLLMFRTRAWGSQLVFLALCVPFCFMHEGAALLTAVLVLACAGRWSGATTAQERMFLAGAALALIAILVYQLGWIIHPRIPGQTSTALQSLAGLRFLADDGRVNLTVITAMLACVALAVIIVRSHRDGGNAASRGTWSVALAFAAAAVVAIVLPWGCERCVAPQAEAWSRYDSLLSGFGLGLLTVYWQRRHEHLAELASAPALVVLACLAAAQASTDLVATLRWKAYTADLSARLASSRGLVPWSSTRDTGDRVRDANWQAFTAGWVLPMLSIVFAPSGEVRAIMDYPADAWRPFEPREVSSLAKIRGVNYAPYRRALSEAEHPAAPSGGTSR